MNLKLLIFFGLHPFHDQDTRKKEYTPNVRELLTDMVSILPGCKYQKAVTPDSLQCIARDTFSDFVNDQENHIADLIICAFFFTMRYCKFSKVSILGLTIMICLRGSRILQKRLPRSSTIAPIIDCIRKTNRNIMYTHK